MEARIPDDSPILARVRCAYCQDFIAEDRVRLVYLRTGSLPCYCDESHKRAAQNRRAYLKRSHGTEKPLPARPRRQPQTIILPEGVFTLVDWSYDVEAESPFEYAAYVTYGVQHVPCDREVAQILTEEKRRGLHHKIRESYERPKVEPAQFIDADDLLGDENEVPDIA